MDEYEGLKNLVKWISEELNLPVIAIIYNPDSEIGYRDSDLVGAFLKEAYIREKSAAVIINGIGGVSAEGLEIALKFRKKFFNKLVCIIPSLAGSSTAYVPLVSNEVLMSKHSFLSKLDLLFLEEVSKDTFLVYRASKELLNGDPDIAAKAKIYHEMSYTILRKILCNKNALLGKNLPGDERQRLAKIEKVCKKLLIGKDHDAVVTANQLKQLGLNIKIYDEDNMTWRKILLLLDTCKKILKDLNCPLLMVSESTVCCVKE